MLKNYLVVAWRNIQKNKGYSLLNILGLAVGMAVFILIFLYVRMELSFARWHEDSERIYRVVQHQPGNKYLGSDRFAVTQAPLAAALMQELPEVVAATRLDNSGNVMFTYKEKNFLEKSMHWADPNLFKVFSVKLLLGDPNSALTDPHSILFSESMAQKYFGETDPLGQTIVFQEKHAMRVTGIFKDFPANSHFTMDIILTRETAERGVFFSVCPSKIASLPHGERYHICRAARRRRRPPQNSNINAWRY